LKKNSLGPIFGPYALVHPMRVYSIQTGTLCPKHFCKHGPFRGFDFFLFKSVCSYRVQKHYFEIIKIGIPTILVMSSSLWLSLLEGAINELGENLFVDIVRARKYKRKLIFVKFDLLVHFLTSMSTNKGSPETLKFFICPL
jgi:hypothetical protein